MMIQPEYPPLHANRRLTTMQTKISYLNKITHIIIKSEGLVLLVNNLERFFIVPVEALMITSNVCLVRMMHA